jgi:tRNA-uridine 2-sulfurtransferase
MKMQIQTDPDMQSQNIYNMKKEEKKKKALLLFSGGLDSILAAKILEEQGMEVTALAFTSYFWGAEEAKKSAEGNGIELKTENFSDAHLRIIKNPKFGRGAGMNPCIDCHLLMLRAAKKIAADEKFKVIATGEVLGQRPMSQKLGALKLIEHQAGLNGKILRPLSAKVLPETEYEKKGIIDRGKLFGISGRGRKVQMALAIKYNIKKYPSPAGGCVLTEKEYSKKLRDLLDNMKNPNARDLQLLRFGRHFWIADKKIILGRNHEENIKLSNLAENGDLLIEPKDIPGPLALLRGGENDEAIVGAKEKIRNYCKNPKRIKFEYVVKKV